MKEPEQVGLFTLPEEEGATTTDGWAALAEDDNGRGFTFSFLSSDDEEEADPEDEIQDEANKVDDTPSDCSPSPLSSTPADGSPLDQTYLDDLLSSLLDEAGFRAPPSRLDLDSVPFSAYPPPPTFASALWTPPRPSPSKRPTPLALSTPPRPHRPQSALPTPPLSSASSSCSTAASASPRTPATPYHYQQRHISPPLKSVLRTSSQPKSTSAHHVIRPAYHRPAFGFPLPPATPPPSHRAPHPPTPTRPIPSFPPKKAAALPRAEQYHPFAAQQPRKVSLNRDPLPSPTRSPTRAKTKFDPKCFAAPPPPPTQAPLSRSSSRASSRSSGSSGSSTSSGSSGKSLPGRKSLKGLFEVGTAL